MRETIPELEIEFTHSGPPLELHRPVCGQKVADSGSITPCDHLVCTHHDHAGDLEPGAPKFGPALESFVDGLDDDELFDLLDTFRARWDHPHTFCIALTSFWFACGPVSETMRFFFEFPVESASEADPTARSAEV